MYFILVPQSLFLGYILQQGTFGAITFSALTNITVFSSTILLVFAYKFGGNFHPLESKIVIPLFAVSMLAAYLYSVIGLYGSPLNYDFDGLIMAQVQGKKFKKPFGILALLQNIYLIIFLFRKAIRLSEPVQPFRSSFVRILTFPFRFLNVKGEKARSMRSFGIASLSPVIYGIVFVLFNARILSRTNFMFLGPMIVMAGMLIYVWAFMGSSAQPTSFQVKIIGLSLVAVLFIISLASLITAVLQEQSYFDKLRFEANAVVETIDDKNYRPKLHPSIVQIQKISSAGRQVLFPESGNWRTKFLPMHERKGFSGHFLDLADIKTYSYVVEVANGLQQYSVFFLFS